MDKTHHSYWTLKKKNDSKKENSQEKGQVAVAEVARAPPEISTQDWNILLSATRAKVRAIAETKEMALFKEKNYKIR